MSAPEREPRPADGAAPLLLAGAAFLVSGAAGLVYQVAWQRILALMSGVGIYSIAMIVAAFMAGLGAGSHLGGRWSLKLSPRRALLTFALVELGIGAFGAASGWLYYDVLYRRAALLYASPWTAGVMHFVALAIPTLLMGTSLPFLVRAMVGEVLHGRPHHRRALRHQPARRRGRRPAHALAADPLLRRAGRDLLGRGRQRRRRPGRARALRVVPPARAFGRRRSGPAARAGRRRRTDAVVRAVDGPLRASRASAPSRSRSCGSACSRWR